MAFNDDQPDLGHYETIIRPAELPAAQPEPQEWPDHEPLRFGRALRWALACLGTMGLAVLVVWGLAA
jgi:hypothetical protein